MAALTVADVPELLKCLSSALQASPAQKAAEAVLQSLEQRPGYCSCLAEIISNKEYDHSARWLASVQFKHNIARSWRNRTLSAEEKQHLRSRLLPLAIQDDNQIALQMALVAAKVARLDFPRDWPSLFQDLLSGITQPDTPTLMARRVYLVLHHVLKELSSKRLAADLKSFAEVSALLLPHLWSCWVADTQTLLAGLPGVAALGAPSTPSAQQPMLILFERWMLQLKVLRRLILFGYPSDAKSLQPVQAVQICAPPMVQALQQLASLRQLLRSAVPAAGGSNGHAGAPGGAGGPGRSQLMAMLDGAILKLAKTQCQVQETHPWSYHSSGALLPMLGFCCDQVLQHTPQASGPNPASMSRSFERFLTRCIGFIVTVCKCGPYKGHTSTGDAASEHEQDAPIHTLSNEISQALGSFWSAGRLTSLAACLLDGYLVLSARDLEEWDASSEEFHHACDVDGWQEHLRSAAEVLLLTLLGAHRQHLAPLVVQALQAATSSCPAGIDPTTLPGPHLPGGSLGPVPVALLRKEAAYAAVAAGAYELHDYLDFTPWLRGSLLLDLAVSSTCSKLIRRRVLRVIAASVARVENVDRPAIYQATLACLADSDKCLQLTAVATLHTLVDDWNFEEAVFADYTRPALGLLMQQVLPGLHELDSQTQVFNLLNVIIERMGDLMRPHVEAVMGLLPGLWHAFNGQSLVRIQILLAMQRLVNVLGAESAASYPLLLPMLQYAVDPQQPEAVHLLEDGLGLWLVAVRNAVEPVPALLALLPLLARGLEQSTEHIQYGCALLSSCVLLGRDAMVQQYCAELSSIFTHLLGNVSERGHLLLLPVLERVIAAAPAAAPTALQPALLKLLRMTVSGKETGLVAAASSCVWSRLLLQAPQALLDLLTCAAGQGLTCAAKPGWPHGLAGAELLLAGLVDVWCEHFDVLALPRQRKLCALGLCALLALPSQVVLLFLDVICAAVTGVWCELEGGGADSHTSAVNPYAGDDSGCDNELNCAAMSEDALGEVSRRAQLSEADPVNHLRVGTQLQAALAVAERSHGAALQRSLASLDPTVAAQVKAACGMASTAM